MDISFKDMKKFYKQITVNYLLNPEKWTRPKVNTERSQMNNKQRGCRCCFDLIIQVFSERSGETGHI